MIIPFKIIQQINPNIILLLVGSGADIEKGRKYAKDLGIDRNTIFTGFFNGDIRDILANIDIFLFPSFWEGLPYAVLEAMNAGKIIISTNVGGIPEIINNENGILIPAKDASILADKTLEVLKDIEKYRPCLLYTSPSPRD